MSKALNKIFAFFGNKWTKLGFSLLSLGYGAFLARVAWLTFAYYFVYENPAALFLLYLFINIIFGIAMIYTRKQILTQIVVGFMHPFILVMLIFGFGNWYLVAPAFVTATVVFFASGVNESLKVILGTTYMIIFFLAVLGYLTLEMLTIRIPVPVDMDFSQRDGNYTEYAKGGGEIGPYRLVAYVDPETDDNRFATYYIEATGRDKKYPFLVCERVLGCVKAGTVKYSSNPDIRWVADDKLWFDGRFVEIDANGKIVRNEEFDDDDGESYVVTAQPPMTQTPEMTKTAENGD
ncbi:MAG: hypothetical protein LBI38_05470 [Oscillospiraceae bacterium]|jgi:hypothetical protein|nr:hypothetical protein [Oscillospiraceae bacterium]